MPVVPLCPQGGGLLAFLFMEAPIGNAGVAVLRITTFKAGMTRFMGDHGRQDFSLRSLLLFACNAPCGPCQCVLIQLKDEK